MVTEQVNARSVWDRAQPPLDRILLGDRHSIKVRLGSILSTPPPTATQIVGQQATPTSTVPVGPPGGMVAAPGQTNTLAVVSLVTAIVAPFAHFTAIGGLTLTLPSTLTRHLPPPHLPNTPQTNPPP